MKVSMLLVPLLALTVSDGRAAEWINLTLKTDRELNSLWFTDVQTGYAVGAGGAILKTVDGGANWASQSSHSTQDLYSVQFATPQTGLVLSLNGFLKTTDGGSTWTPLSITDGGWSSLCVLDTNRIFVAGGMGIARSVNGGANWTIANVGSGLGVKDVYFPEAQIGYAVNQKMIFKSVDGGVTWTTLPEKIEGTELSSVFFTSRDVGFVVGGYPGVIYKTVDGGKTWTQTPVNPFLGSVHFSDALHGAIAGSGSVMMTEDGGLTWKEYPVKNAFNLTDVHFPRPDLGYAVGTSNTGTAPVLAKFEGTPLQVLLPHSNGQLRWESGRLGYKLNKASTVRIQVLDARGATLAGLVDDVKEAGAYSLPWRPEAFPRGSLLEFQAEGSRETILVLPRMDSEVIHKFEE